MSPEEAAPRVFGALREGAAGVELDHGLVDELRRCFEASTGPSRRRWVTEVARIVRFLALQPGLGEAVRTLEALLRPFAGGIEAHDAARRRSEFADERLAEWYRMSLGRPAGDRGYYVVPSATPTRPEGAIEVHRLWRPRRLDPR
jgi:hypothetical protein